MMVLQNYFSQLLAAVTLTRHIRVSSFHISRTNNGKIQFRFCKPSQTVNLNLNESSQLVVLFFDVNLIKNDHSVTRLSIKTYTI